MAKGCNKCEKGIKPYKDVITKLLKYIEFRLTLIEKEYDFKYKVKEYSKELDILCEILYRLEPIKNNPDIGSLEKDIYRRFATLRNQDRYYKLLKAKNELIRAGILKSDHGQDNYPIDYCTRF